MSDQSTPHHDAEHVQLRNRGAEIQSVASRLLAATDRHAYSKAARFAIRLAFEEAVSNAFRHGHRELPPDTPIDVEYEVSDSKVRIAVQDRGAGFSLERVPDPTLDENLDKPEGRGLMLIRAYMTCVKHNPEGNRVEMEYVKPPDESG